MKITIELYDTEHIIQTDFDDLDIYDMMDYIERILLSMGYHPESVKEGFFDKVEEYKNNGEENE